MRAAEIAKELRLAYIRRGGVGPEIAALESWQREVEADAIERCITTVEGSRCSVRQSGRGCFHEDCDLIDTQADKLRSLAPAPGEVLR